MSIQQNFPAISPSLNLNFARSKTLDPRITFSRTSTATRVNEQGLVEVMSADIPRFDHEYDASTGVVKSLGLLVEESRTNNIQVSAPAPADISKATNVEGWLDRSGINFEFSSVTSPDGTNNAVGVAYTSAYSNFQIPFFYNQQSLLTSDTTYTLSFWVDDTELVESNGYHLATIIGTNSFFSTSGRYFRVNYNKDTDTFSSPLYSTGSSVNAENANTIFPSANISADVEKYPNNWKRISITFKVASDYDGFYDSGNTLADFRFSYGIYMGVSGATNDNVGNSMSTWGWQLEQAEFPTSYIPTSGGTATRNPDSVTMTGENFSDWYNQEQGSFLWIGNVYSREISPVQPFRVNQGANLRGLGIQFNTISANNTTTFVSRTQTSTIPGKVAPSGIIPSDNKIKIAGGYIESVGLSTIRAAFNGLPEDSYSGSSQTDITYDTMYEMEIMGNRGITGTNNQFTGVCEQLVYYPRILSDDQLQNLTK